MIPLRTAVLIGVLAGGLAVVAGIAIAKNGWIALGLIAIDRLAAAIHWRTARRPLVGQALALSGIAAAIALVVVNPSLWWATLFIWLWMSENVWAYFKPLPKPSAVADDDQEEADVEESEEET